MEGVVNMYDIKTLPSCEITSFARWIARTVEKYYEDPDVKRRFDEWDKEQTQKNASA